MPLTNLPSNRSILLVNAGDDPGIIINRDLVNLVAFGEDSAFSPISASLIDPLTFIQYSGDADLWAQGVNAIVQVDKQPNNQNWSPSPAASAASIAASGLALESTQLNQLTGIPNNIAATGVPLLNLRNVLQNITGQAIAAGATYTAPLITGINQPSYNLHIEPTAGAGTYPFLTVTLTWIDSTFGLTVQVDTYTTSMSTTTGALKTVVYGPTDSDQLQITVTNNDTVGCTLSRMYITSSSRPNYDRDTVYQYWSTAAMPPVQGYQASGGQRVPTGRILFSLTRSVSNGVTTTPDYIFPLWAGPVFISFIGVSSNTWTVLFTDTGTLVPIARIDLTTGNNNLEMIFPRAPVSVHITNGGSVTSVLNFEVIAGD